MTWQLIITKRLRKNGFYNSEERPADTKELLDFINEILGSENKVLNLPYHPFFVKEKE